MSDTPTTDQPTLAVTLKPCPFCGGSPDPVPQNWHFSTEVAICCDGPCELWGPLGADAEEAITAWNTRTNSEPRPAGDLREAAQFLSDRLDDLEWMDGELESTLRDYMGHVDPAHARLRALLDADPTSLEGGEGWRDIAALTEEDGYVIGWAERSDGCADREHFLGRKYDIRTNALINEWTGRWRAVSHWQPLTRPAAHPSTQEGADRG